MADKKTSVLPRIEILIILVFFISFLGWAANKCSRTKSQLQAENTSLTTDSLDQLVDTIAAVTSTTPTPAPVEQTPDPIIQARPILYVVIDDLNMRTAPNLNSDIISVLNLFEEVEFMNEVTDSTTQLKLSETITVDEPWVKVKNKKGRTGWVYGAGVHYHRKKYPGL